MGCSFLAPFLFCRDSALMPVSFLHVCKQDRRRLADNKRFFCQHCVTSGSGGVFGHSVAPHWFAIAFAIPVNVLLRCFQRSGPGGAR